MKTWQVTALVLRQACKTNGAEPGKDGHFYLSDPQCAGQQTP